MNKGMILALSVLLTMLWPGLAPAEGEIYRIVDKDGNVTFTDQKPSDTAKPMDLPPLSVVESAIETPDASAEPSAEQEPEARAPTLRELRQRYADFRITQPAQEETFWGTANTVVVAWGATEPPLPDMSARLYVDGAPREVPASGNLSLTLDRGEHTVYAELLDVRNRPIVTTERVTFFVHQASVNFNRPAVSRSN